MAPKNSLYSSSLIKRVFDVILSFCLLVILSPIILVAAIGVAFSSPGPILYRAIRCGHYGKRFHMYKIRSMHLNSDKLSRITSHCDPRIFFWGKILRSLKVDEFPQLYNILIGDMSFVGPRPEDPKFVELNYSEWMHETLAVRPGLTSPGTIFATINSRRYLDNPDSESRYISHLLFPKLALDKSYLEGSSFLSDIFLLFYTAFFVFLLQFDFTIEVEYFSERRANILSKLFSRGLYISDKN